MNLTPRLQKIVNHVPEKTICGDIGTDHAYIPIYLVQNKICPKVIATDICKGPLEIAQKQIKVSGFQKQIEIRLGNGLKPIEPGEIETVIIAGMGGLLIRDILECSKETTKKIKIFILQPMSAQRELRQYLIKNNFKIIKEDLAREDQRIYEIIIAIHGKQGRERDIYLDIPKFLIEERHPLLIPFIEKKKKEILKIMKQCEGKYTPNAESKLKECRKKIKKIEEVEKCL
ncbi:tRNA (adenine(22)-N(1))-methyltransferase [Garciella nitratireducens]|uniref:tRNA (Adenine22-N1)-methyltransferase n=1 Tax=Garciella nitratireducens DSM 15102 TaxID=1121911 RepID=A0A1T4JS41_9FIRM|nr:class I SAM-dependent methyltransferase [Garciella nitratireducens]RBP45515.1 tRNA (adenine22-N1)-methyltransferase [Garciella nitratireducens]SJZ32953.1 tRNA (adenine22-N1)-methyltransferase [Garciella nitratireducens DSM 15102]